MMDFTKTAKVLDEVAVERLNQNAKWGEQNHPDGTGWLCGPDPGLAKKRYEDAKAARTLTWLEILDEEFAEALAEKDQGRLREELIQVAAVAVAWVECIDRRKK